MFDHVVSVGGDCQPAHQIRRITGRDEAHVFDWLLIRAAGVARLVASDFDGFLDDDAALSLHVSPYAHVADAHSGAHLLHDFPLVPGFLLHADAVRRKYAFLVARWRLLVAAPGPVLFVWLGSEGRDAVAPLAEALRQQRAGRPFHLLALRSDAAEPDWRLPDVSNRFLRQPAPYVWTGDDAAWDGHFGVGGDATQAEPASRATA
ncbi:MAG: DUF1796 family putative cysteine peptidase [Pseudomonadota bacterium]